MCYRLWGKKKVKLQSLFFAAVPRVNVCRSSSTKIIKYDHKII
uniref:Uncharacterized protein n=1 Tax=Setaria italica TaxID=4555 RepID=K3ZPM0_SETIT